MPYNRITNDDRRRIVRKVQEGWTTKAIATALDFNYYAVFKIVKIFLATREYLSKQQGGNRRSKLIFNFLTFNFKTLTFDCKRLTSYRKRLTF